jgi:AcrR family transcriptional regulator
MTGSDAIKEQLLEARRNQILDAAAATFAAKGFHGATTKEIAGTAGVSEGTIYNYFDTKFDLLIGIMSRLAEVEQLPSELAGALGGDVREFFVAAFQQRLSRIEQGEEMLQAILPQVFVQQDLRAQFYQEYVRPIAAALEAYVQTQIQRGHVRAVNVALTVRLLQSTFVGLLVMRILGDEALCSEWSQVPEVLASLLFDSLSTERAG